MPPTVCFDCELRQIKSMADGTVNVTVNLPEYHIKDAKTMLDWLGGMMTVEARFQGKEDDE